MVIMAEELVFDFLNWQTMILELVIAGIVAGVFFWKQKQQGDKVENLVSEIKQFEENQEKFTKEQEEFRKKRHDWALNRLKSILPHLADNLSALEESAQSHEENTKSTQVIEVLETLIEAQEILREHYIHRVERISDQSVGIISPELLEIIDEIIAGANKKVRKITDKGIQYDAVFYKPTIERINDFLKNHLE